MVDDFSVADSRAEALTFGHKEEIDLPLPRFDHCNNYEQVICYAICLLCGHFKKYGSSELAYDPIEYTAPKDDILLWNIRGKSVADVAQNALNKMAAEPNKDMYDLEKTLDVLSQLFSIRTYQHGDVDVSR